MSETAIEKKTEIIFPISKEKLETIKEEFAIIPDCESVKGRKEAQKGITKLVSMRTTIDKARKEMTAKSRQYQKDVNETATKIIAELAPFEKNWKDAKLLVENRIAEEKAEKQRLELVRIEKIRELISDIQKIPFLKPDYSSVDCLNALSALASIEVTEETYQELTSEAVQVHLLAELTLKDMNNSAVIREEEAEKAAEAKRVADKAAADLAEKNRVQAEKLQKQQEELDAKEAEQAKVAAENKRIEQERLDREQAAWEAEKKKEREEWEARVKKEDAERASLEKKREEDQRKRAEEAAKIEAERIARVEAEDEARKKEEHEAWLKKQDFIAEQALENKKKAEALAKKEEQIAETEAKIAATKADLVAEAEKAHGITEEDDEIEDAASELNVTLVDFFCNLESDISADDIFVLAESIVTGKITDVKYIGVK